IRSKQCDATASPRRRTLIAHPPGLRVPGATKAAGGAIEPDLTALTPRLKIHSARYLRRADCASEAGDDGAYRVMLGIARPIRAHRVNLIVDECQLPDHRRGQHERIEIRLAHAAVDGIDRKRQWQPGVD